MDKLLFDIQMKRQEMVELGMKTGFNSFETLTASQELDLLIVKYQRCKERMDKPLPRLFFMKRAFSDKIKHSLSNTFLVAVVTNIIKS
ncbi:aspartyl-phosphate phosphatase Spo0E family protein [Microbacteriaceae bacterium 4G12]